MSIQLPTARQLAQQLGRLVRREVEVKPLTRPGAARLLHAGAFHGGDRRPIALAAADLRFAAYSGAALSLIPADAADDCIKAGKLDDTLEENFAEVLNVLARAFVVPDSQRVALIAPIHPPAAVPTTVEGAASVKRADFEIEVDGYGSGVLALWSAA